MKSFKPVTRSIINQVSHDHSTFDPGKIKNGKRKKGKGTTFTFVLVGLQSFTIQNYVGHSWSLLQAVIWRKKSICVYFNLCEIGLKIVDG